MQIPNDTKNEVDRRVRNLTGLTAPVDVVGGLVVGYAVGATVGMPSGLTWWALGGVIAVALIAESVFVYRWLLVTTSRNATPIDVEWDSHGLVAHLPAIAGGAASPPREVRIAWGEIRGVTKPGMLRLATIRYGHGPISEPPDGAPGGDALVLAESVAARIEEAWGQRTSARSPPP